MKKQFTYLFAAIALLLLFTLPAIAQGSLGIAEKAESFIETELRPILNVAALLGIIIGGIMLVISLFTGDNQNAKKYLKNIGLGILAVACLSGIISWVASITI